MTAMVLAILVASLVGSLHCAGMCGAFVVLATGTGTSTRSAAFGQTAYHLGRLVSYTILGALAGAAGRLIDLTSTLAGLQPLAAGLAGAAMVAFGITALLRSSGVKIAGLRLPSGWNHLIARVSASQMNRPPIIRAACIGLCTTLLPCGWLYAFVLTAAGTGNPLNGALVMAIFWLGTLPALIVVGSGVRQLLGPLGRRAPAITSVLLVLVGLYTLLGRSLMDPAAIAARIQNRDSKTATTLPCCTTQP
jgi:uncharacterized protein